MQGRVCYRELVINENIVHGLAYAKSLKTLVPMDGLEPPTHALRMRCSTN